AFPEGEISKLIGCLSGVQQQTNVGRRNRGCRFSRLILYIVGNQPVVLAGGKLQEVSPDVQRRLPQQPLVAFREFTLGSDGTAIEPERKGLAAEPEHQYR